MAGTIKQINGVIFDLDGTMLNTLEDLADSCNRVLLSEGFSTHPVNSYKYFIGNGIVNLIKNALPESHRDNEELISKITGKMRIEYSHNWNKKTYIYDGVKELLYHLGNCSIPVSVLSNKADNFTKEMVKYYFPDFKFNQVIGEKNGVPRKPHPYAAIQLIESMGVTPEKTALIGDSGTDMQTATAAGAIPIGVLWGFRDRTELITNNARYCLSKPLDFIEIFPEF